MSGGGAVNIDALKLELEANNRQALVGSVRNVSPPSMLWHMARSDISTAIILHFAETFVSLQVHEHEVGQFFRSVTHRDSTEVIFNGVTTLAEQLLSKRTTEVECESGTFTIQWAVSDKTGSAATKREGFFVSLKQGIHSVTPPEVADRTLVNALEKVGIITTDPKWAKKFHPDTKEDLGLRTMGIDYEPYKIRREHMAKTLRNILIGTNDFAHIELSKTVESDLRICFKCMKEECWTAHYREDRARLCDRSGAGPSRTEKEDRSKAYFQRKMIKKPPRA